MNFVVCVKRVPDTETKVAVGPDRKAIDPSGVKFILNPYDEIAAEMAIQLKEKKGGGEITIVSLGPEEATKEIRTCMAMGADKGVLIKDPKGNRDPVFTAKVLTDVIKDLNYDVIFFGKKAVDDDQGQVGSIVAAMLKLPCVTGITKIEIEDGKAAVHREIEGGTEVVEVSLPAVFTAEKGLAEPRYPALKGIMMAKKKTLEIKDLQEVEPAQETENMELPPPRQAGKIVGEGKEAVPSLIELLKNESKIL